ncbi:hypothetical protein NBRC116188_15770 [Oceaniserpentilla sp. 4NH20-0058]|uniref:GNAT family N-acetyltransferase n=1 Tax=Oceaniserpentilla sp. 4NH20-0058 TaxID=3127660 RepID=UPI003105C532
MRNKIYPYYSEYFHQLASIYDACKLDELIYEGAQFQLVPLVSDEVRKKALLDSSIYFSGDSNPLGYVAFNEQEIVGLNVLSEARGTGLGRSLLLFALNKMKRPVYLQVVTSNQAAMSLYYSLGFCFDHETKVLYNGVSVKISRLVLI